MLPGRSDLVDVVRHVVDVDRPDQAFHSTFERPLRGGGAVEVPGGDGAVAQHHEMSRGVARASVPGVCEGAPHPLEVPAAVFGNNLAHGVLGVFELRGGVDEGTAAKPLVPDLGDDFGADRGNELATFLPGRARLGPLDESVVDGLQVADDEVLLAREMTVEGCQGHVAGGDDAIHAHAVYPL